jgi:hypothetical protein
MKLNVNTPQEAFDKVIRHLATQGHRATDGRRCLYRGEGGDRCAIGALFDDDQYQPRFEGMGVYSLGIEFPSEWERAHAPWTPSQMLSHLQEIHDTAYHWNDDGFIGWTSAAEVALRFGLDGTVIDEVRGQLVTS